MPRPVRIDDFLRFVVPGSVQIAAGGELLIWVERSVDPERKISVSHLAGAGPGGNPRRLTSADRGPPDGRRVAFVRREVGQGRHPAELCLVAADGGDARVLATVDGDLADPVWSPDGRHVIVAARRADPVAEGEHAPLSIRVHRVFYKLEGGRLPAARPVPSPPRRGRCPGAGASTEHRSSKRRAREATSPEAVGFTELAIEPVDTSAGSIEVVVDARRVVRVGSGFEAATLARVLDVVEARP